MRLPYIVESGLHRVRGVRAVANDIEIRLPTMAERAVRRITGVRVVTNLIRVQPSTPSPTDVKQRIEAALLRNAKTDAERIQVEASGGTVTLRGTVRSHAEKQEAAQVAWSAPGVKAVEHHIPVAA